MIPPARITSYDRMTTPTAPATTLTPEMNISAHAGGVAPWFACGAAGGGSDLGTCGYGGGFDMSCFLHRSAVLSLSLRGRRLSRGLRIAVIVDGGILSAAERIPIRLRAGG